MLNKQNAQKWRKTLQSKIKNKNNNLYLTYFSAVIAESELFRFKRSGIKCDENSSFWLLSKLYMLFYYRHFFSYYFGIHHYTSNFFSTIFATHQCVLLMKPLCILTISWIKHHIINISFIFHLLNNISILLRHCGQVWPEQ